MWKNISKYSFLIIIFQLFLSNLTVFASNEDVFSVVKFKLNDEFNYKNLLYYGFDLETVKFEKGFCSILTDKYERNLLNQLHVKFDVIEPDVYKNYKKRMSDWNSEKHNFDETLDNNFKFGSMGGYFTLEETYRQFDSMKILYPDYLVDSDTIGYTFENRPIISYTFGDTLKRDKEVLLTALHHAREPGGASVIIYFLFDLLNKAAEGNREALYLLQHRTLYVIPVVNPDGLFYNETIKPNGGGMWRKNRFMINDSVFGVDLNRNYGPYEYWNAPVDGSSDIPEHSTYRGVAPFSEAETQALRDFVTPKNIKLAFNYHTYGNLVLYPYSALVKDTPDSLFFRNLAEEFSCGNRYVYGRDQQTVRYTGRGVSDDWFYWTDEKKKTKTFAFTPEVGRVFDGFWTTPDRLLEQCKENLYMNYQLLWSADINWRPRNIRLFDIHNKTIKINTVNTGVNNTAIKPIVYLSSLNPDISIEKLPVKDTLFENQYEAYYKFNISKNARNGESVEIQIETIQDGVSRLDTMSLFFWQEEKIKLFTDEELFGQWDKGKWDGEFNIIKNHFVLSDSPNAYYQDRDTNYLQMTEPIELNFNAAYLSFEAFWEIETNYDYGIVEISTDLGKTWKKLDTRKMAYGSGARGSVINIDESGFTGTSFKWFKNKINLNNYLGKNILFRFGMLSDMATNAPGLLLDNIYIIHFRDIPASVVCNDIDDIVLFPNPVKKNEDVNINILHSWNILKIVVFDLTGNSYTLDNMTDNNNYTFKFEHKGVYFVQLFFKNGRSIVKKLLVI
jgi:hypothetical protein